MDYNQDWAYDDVLVKRLVRFASQLEKKHEGEKVLSLGQSFSWPVYTLGRIREHSGKPADNGYIPFSGATLRLDETHYGITRLAQEITEPKPGIMGKINNILKGRPLNFTHTPADPEFKKRYYRPCTQTAHPTKADLKRYFRNLEEQGVGLSNIAGHFQETGQRTAILEKVCMGDGFYTFLSLWITEAKARGLENDIKDAAYFMVYSLNAGLLQPGSTQLDSDSAPEYPVEVIEPVKKREIELIQSFSRDNSLDENSSRLVDLYNISARAHGNKPKIQKADNADKISFIKDKIERFIDRELG